METDAPAVWCRQAPLRVDDILGPLHVCKDTTYPPISSIPRTSPERLALASPENHSDSGNTVLYLAYGSNLCAATFLGSRGIRPISSINVSAPALDLTFDLPGIPYSEPCFANTAPRKKIPDPPPIPGDPTKPPIQFPPPQSDKDHATGTFPALPIRGPTWSKGLVGVVYEVSQADYAHIVKTEGGGASYQDVLTPCLPFPPPLHVPEKPPIPELPKPFLAHTLFAPRLPADPPTGKWWQKLMLPIRRPEADYAQPSLRYLRLIRVGAAEHYLPQDYQDYLEKLEAYTITQRRQEIGKWLFTLVWTPFFMLFLGLSKLFADKEGKIPKWLVITLAVVFNLMWLSYDGFFKKHFGDGERTVEEEEDDEESNLGARTNTLCRWTRSEARSGTRVLQDQLPDEKTGFLDDMH